jgi:hypothetical protein
MKLCGRRLEKHEMSENWKCLDFIGYPKYFVSDLGRVKGPIKMLKFTLAGNGKYPVVSLCNAEGIRNFQVHKLVALAFVPNPLGYTEVNHLDTNRLNPKVDNLEWCLHVDNIAHSYYMGTRKKGENSPRAKLTQEQVSYIRKVYIKGDRQFGMNALARQFKVNSGTICHVLRRSTWND